MRPVGSSTEHWNLSVVVVRVLVCVDVLVLVLVDVLLDVEVEVALVEVLLLVEELLVEVVVPVLLVVCVDGQPRPWDLQQYLFLSSDHTWSQNMKSDAQWNGS